MADALDIAGGIAGAIEATVPVVAPFSPLISLILTAIRAHMNATNGQFPSEADIQAALPKDYAALVNVWAAWDAAHPAPQK